MKIKNEKLEQLKKEVEKMKFANSESKTQYLFQRVCLMYSELEEVNQTYIKLQDQKIKDLTEQVVKFREKIIKLQS